MIDLSKMTRKQIATLPHSKVFEEVRAGTWTRVDFDTWLEEVLVQSYGDGYDEGFDCGKENRVMKDEDETIQ